MRIKRRIAGVAYPGKAWAADAHRFEQQRDLIRRQLHAVLVDLYAAIDELVDEGIGLAQPLMFAIEFFRETKTAFQLRCAVGDNVLTVVVSGGKAEVEVAIAEDM